MVCLGRIEGQTNPPDLCKDIGANGGSSAVAAAVPEPQPRRILGIFPNHNASPCLSPYVAIIAKDKFKIAGEDAFDPGAVALAALTGGQRSYSTPIARSARKHRGTVVMSPPLMQTM
jgi:hypothetical protein